MTGGNKVRWLGHATFEIVTSEGTKVLIDPWITGNPACPEDKEAFTDVDVILVTHDHFDHMGEDIPFLGERTDAVAVAQPEIVASLKKQGMEECVGMNIGGTVQAAGIEITMVQAFHSSTVGSPCGYIVTTEDGTRIYHAGDTGVFASMKLFGDLYDIDLALLPIGSVYVMDPQQAAQAVRMLEPERVVPMHFGTFPALVQSADEFIDLVREKAPDSEVCVLEPGEEITV